MTKETIRALIKRAQEKDEIALAELVNQHTDLVWSVVHKLKRMNVDTDDLFQVGCTGLLKAIEGFNFSFDVTLTTYAVPLIMGEIRAYLRALSPVKISRQVNLNGQKIAAAKDDFLSENGREATISELASLTALTEEDVITAMNAPAHAMSLDYAEDDDVPLSHYLLDQDEKNFTEMVELREIISELSAKEKTLIYMRYDLGLKQQEVATRMGLNQVGVSRLEKKILAKLKEKLTS